MMMKALLLYGKSLLSRLWMADYTAAGSYQIRPQRGICIETIPLTIGVNSNRWRTHITYVGCTKTFSYV